MGLFNLFKRETVKPEDVDYISNAEEFESKGDYASAIGEYEKIVQYVYAKKDPRHYRHVTKRIVGCYQKLGEYDKVFEMWKGQYDPMDYGAKEMYELIKVLEAAQRVDLVSKVYEMAGRSLAANHVEFLVKQKKIPEANELLSELLAHIPESNPSIQKLWLAKAKLCLSLRKWEEANKYLSKLIEKNPHNEEARKLKEFCFKQLRSN